MRRKPIAIDLFCGAGGATQGLRDAGFRIALGVDIDRDSLNSYKSNHPSVQTMCADLSKVSARSILRKAGLSRGQCDLLIGCPPCQGFSSHRLGKSGAQDPRNQLVEAYARLIVAIRPRYFIFENVPGLKKDKQHWIGALKRLRSAGYTFSVTILDAADFGVAQHRKRLTVVGTRLQQVTVGVPTPTHYNPVSGKNPRWKTVRQEIGRLQKLESGAASSTDPLHFASSHTPGVMKLIKSVPLNGGSRKDLPVELVLDCHLKHDGHKDVYGRLSWDKPSVTITSGCTQPSRGRFLHPEQDRGISLREAAVLQGFPKKYVFKGTKQSIALQIGNALPPPLAYQLGRLIISARLPERGCA